MNLDHCATLLLDNGYQPLSVVGWQRALMLDLSDRVDVVEYYDNIQVRSPSRSFQLPAVIRLRQYLRRIPRVLPYSCLLYTSPSPRDLSTSRMPSSA